MTKLSLTNCQEQALIAIQDWWESKEKHFLLSGAPGTGKTFLAEYAIKGLKGAVPLFTAPTNEAVRQLELALSDDGVGIKTTYSALGLSLSTKSFKQYIYQRALPEDFDDFNLLIVDEASFAGKNVGETNKADLMDYVMTCGMRTIWMGDWAQLPPVNQKDGESPVFNEGFTGVELLEVKRHAGDILKFNMSLREIIKKTIRNLPSIPESIKTKPIKDSFNLSQEDFEMIISDRARILVWTNKATKYCPAPGVKEYNDYIRGRLFGEDLAKKAPVYPTDKILFASPLFRFKDAEKLTKKGLENEESELIASVNTRAEVVKTEPVTILGIKSFKTEIALEGGKTVTCYIPTNEGQVSKNELEQIIKAKASKLTGREAGKAWEYFHKFRSVFADIKYTYCITGHRAQGSTVEKVFVSVPNILQNRDRKVAFKNLNVCCSRSQKELVLFV